MSDSSKTRALVTNIQRFSLHDGPGIRTTVFLKGCSLHCPWCANPENISCGIEPYYKDGKFGEYGKWYASVDLYDELIRDIAFFRECENASALGSYQITSPHQLPNLPGGVTFSGGGPLLQFKILQPLLKRLKKEAIHLCAETCLFVPPQELQIAIEYIDLFYVDLKILDIEQCRTVLNGPLELFEDNLSILLQSQRPVIFRVPVIAKDESGNGTLYPINQERIAQKISDSIQKGNVIKVELIKEHNLGLSKYRALKNAGADIIIPQYLGVNDQQMKGYKQIILERMMSDNIPVSMRIPVEICKI